MKRRALITLAAAAAVAPAAALTPVKPFTGLRFLDWPDGTQCMEEWKDGQLVHCTIFTPRPCEVGEWRGVRFVENAG